MKSKQLIRFYFGAEGLNIKLDKMMMRYACGSGGTDGEKAAEWLLKMIGVKGELQGLWGYLDGAMGGLTGGEREVLKYYGGLREGIRRLPRASEREIRRVTVKFARRIRRVERYGAALKILGAYYSLL